MINNIKINRFLFKNVWIIFFFLFSSCILNKEGEVKMTDEQVATSWADMTLYITQKTPANTPTYASRCLGYIGLTMYESVVSGFPENKSMEGQLNGLINLPKTNKKDKYCLPVALNASQAQIIKSIYNQTSDLNKVKIDSLENLILMQFSERIKDKKVIERSVAFGRAIANHIFEWSKTDGGHRGYLNNFDKKLVNPSFLGSWKPPLYAQSFSHFPLHPHWGKNRTFLNVDNKLANPKFIKADTLKSAEYYLEFQKVYEKNKSLTQEEKEIAIWWSDDPDETPTPPGHSFYLATLVAKKSNAGLIKTVETYAKVGMAVADAFINCWKWKYVFFTERPNTFIPKHIDQLWESFWPDPPFPAFPSGHAIQAGAAATVMANTYGNNFDFTDSLNVGRKKDELRNTEFKARHFNSFWQVAEETANSRFFGGIHCPQDNTAGLIKGKEIGENINRLKWKN